MDDMEKILSFIISGDDLSKKDLSKIKLAGADLSGFDLNGANLWSADLHNANLSGANLSKADLQNANLLDANLSGADLTGADLTGANLECADLTGAKLDGTQLVETKMNGIKLNDANLKYANLRSASLIQADLNGANLTGANLTRALLASADLQNANLQDVDLTHTNFKGARMPENCSENEINTTSKKSKTFDNMKKEINSTLRDFLTKNLGNQTKAVSTTNNTTPLSHEKLRRGTNMGISLKLEKKPWLIASLCMFEQRIDLTPKYQRNEAWKKHQKQLFVDSILRMYDIPKVYLRRVNREDNIDFEVIDGQQRLRTIWEFKSGNFELDKYADPVMGIQIKGQKFNDLDLKVCEIFNNYPVDVVTVDDTQSDDDDEVREMFLRLQNGTTLKAQEVRNAMPGQMVDFVINLSLHKFFNNCKFTNTRSTFSQVAAQMTCLELASGPTNVRKFDLNRMYIEYSNFDSKGKIAKRINQVLNYLHRAFPEKTPILERHNVITLYCLASELIRNYAHKGTEEKLSRWFNEFEKNRQMQAELNESDQDIQLIEYKRLTSSSTDGEESIRGRVEFVQKRFFRDVPDILPTDPERDFTDAQRSAIYLKNEGRCQIKIRCGGEKLDWSDDWEADHIIPHSASGQTTVANGQVACQACNRAKSDSI